LIINSLGGKKSLGNISLMGTVFLVIIKNDNND